MEITATPTAEDLGSLVGQFVTVSFSTGSVIGAGGFTRLEAVDGDRVTLTTKGLPRTASISLIDRITTVALVPRQGRRF